MSRIGMILLLGLVVGVFAGGAHAEADPPGVLIDGEMVEWGAGEYVLADEHYFYLRLPMDELRPLYTRDRPITVRFDLDDDRGTGQPYPDLGIGADFEMVLQRGEEWRDPPIIAEVIDGEPVTELSFEGLRPVTMPTHAAREFEMRIRRDAHSALMLGGRGSGVIEVGDGEIRFSYEAPAGAALGHADVELPGKADGSVRFVVHNVLWSNPESSPEPFGRMYRALDADIYLIQEWGRDDWSEAYDRALEAWFAEHVDPERRWTAVRTEAQGVAVVTPHEVTVRGPRELRVEQPNSRWTFPVRLASAVIETPAGEYVVGSIHLKCCGTLGSEEDVRRLDEARTINAMLGDIAEAAQGPGEAPPVVILGGDYNHNGDPGIVEAALAGIDVDGTPLTFAETPVLGTNAVYTWGGATRGHRRSHLDYLAYSDANAEVTAAFVLDTTVLSDNCLVRLGCERSDTDASDHLPVVVDIRAK